MLSWWCLLPVSLWHVTVCEKFPKSLILTRPWCLKITENVSFLCYTTYLMICLIWNILSWNQFEIFMKRKFTTAMRVFGIFVDVFDLNAIFLKVEWIWIFTPKYFFSFLIQHQRSKTKNWCTYCAREIDNEVPKMPIEKKKST